MAEQSSVNEPYIPPPFVSAGKAVMQGSKCVAIATSSNFAKRIARALNAHKVNSRGV